MGSSTLTLSATMLKKPFSGGKIVRRRVLMAATADLRGHPSGTQGHRGSRLRLVGRTIIVMWSYSGSDGGRSLDSPSMIGGWSG